MPPLRKKERKERREEEEKNKHSHNFVIHSPNYFCRGWVARAASKTKKVLKGKGKSYTAMKPKGSRWLHTEAAICDGIAFKTFFVGSIQVYVPSPLCVLFFLWLIAVTFVSHSQSDVCTLDTVYSHAAKMQSRDSFHAGLAVHALSPNTFLCSL